MCMNVHECAWMCMDVHVATVCMNVASSYSVYVCAWIVCLITVSYYTCLITVCRMNAPVRARMNVVRYYSVYACCILLQCVWVCMNVESYYSVHECCTLLKCVWMLYLTTVCIYFTTVCTNVASYYRVAKIHGCLKLQVTFHKRATNNMALLRKITHKDKASHI